MSADDIDDYKLETSFEKSPDAVIHTSYRSDRKSGIRRAIVVEKWLPQTPDLGGGTFGTVRLEKLVAGPSDSEVQYRAVKQLYKPQMQRMRVDVRKELIALTKFSRAKFAQSQLFVEFYGWFENEQTIFIGMEYFKEGTLAKYITQELKEWDVRAIAFQLLEGLKIMHQEKFTHRDLKPENIFVVEKGPQWWVKIGDFGISKRVSDEMTALRTNTGTPYYRAPEIAHYVEVEGNEDSDEYTDKVDIWSFACVVYQLLALEVPFKVFPRSLIAYCRGKQFRKKRFLQRYLPPVSPEAIGFVRSVLIPHPSLRPTADEAMNLWWLRTEKLLAAGKFYTSQPPDYVSGPAPRGPPPVVSLRQYYISPQLEPRRSGQSCAFHFPVRKTRRVYGFKYNRAFRPYIDDHKSKITNPITGESMTNDLITWVLDKNALATSFPIRLDLCFVHYWYDSLIKTITLHVADGSHGEIGKSNHILDYPRSEIGTIYIDFRGVDLAMFPSSGEIPKTVCGYLNQF